MEDPRCPHQQHPEPALHAGQADVVQGPIPIVVVEGAEPGVARVDPAPKVASEGHPHVVLGAQPVGHGNLAEKENVQVKNVRMVCRETESMQCFFT